MMSLATRRINGEALFVGVLVFCLGFVSTDAFDPLDPNGNITIKWDVISWAPDGYTTVITIVNYQKYRHIESPGWRLGWTWAKKEVIWDAVGGQATEQGDCSRFKGSTPPHCCLKSPTIVDMMPGTPYNKQIANCCRGGAISSWVQDPATAISSFQLSVGQAGTTNKTVTLPEQFTLQAPGPGYTCGPATIVEPTKFLTPDKRRITQTLMTWNVTCTYSPFLAQRTPTCCVSLSAFYSETIVGCLGCSCGCENQAPGKCVDSKSPHISSVVPSSSPAIQCTRHMCPIRVHWHIKLNYKQYWRVKIAITNFNYAKNYSQWSLVVQHPNFDNITQIFSYNSALISEYINDTALMWGVKYYNDLLMQAGTSGNAQSELLFGKGKSFTFDKGWAFPRRVYFNGDNCVMPPPDTYPALPNGSARKAASLLPLVTSILMCLVVFLTRPW